MKCLVTGGAGFIGSNLVDELVSQGHEVKVIDNLSSGDRNNLNSKAEFFNKDIRNLDEIKPVFDKVDYVFHMAALTQVQDSILNPTLHNEINITGTLNVLEATRLARVKKFVFTSSAAVYGDREEVPFKEADPVAPMSPYALHKYAGEEYCKLYSRIYNLPTVCLRYFNVFGNRMPQKGDYRLAIVVFMEQRLNNEPMTIVGDGNQYRDFVGVADVVEANILSAESEKVGKGEVINIGTGKKTTVNDLAKIIGGPTTNIPPRIEPKEALADISKAKELLNWEPKTELAPWIEGYKKGVGLV